MNITCHSFQSVFLWQIDFFFFNSRIDLTKEKEKRMNTRKQIMNKTIRASNAKATDAMMRTAKVYRLL